MELNYNKWYENLGVVLEDEIKLWINSIPDTLDITDILGDTSDFIASTLRDAYTYYVEENEQIEHQYYEDQEQVLLEGHCF